MGREQMVTESTDPDRLVSWNLRRARELRGWTQGEATQHLARFGRPWSVASLSDAERAWTPDGRQREFTATDLVAFSLTYDLPLAWWILPPPPSERGSWTVELDGVEQDLVDTTLVNLCLASSSEIEDRISSLGIARHLAAEDQRHLLALLTAQESQMAEWIAELRSARAAVEHLPGDPHTNSEESE